MFFDRFEITSDDSEAVADRCCWKCGSQNQTIFHDGKPKARREMFEATKAEDGNIFLPQTFAQTEDLQSTMNGSRIRGSPSKGRFTSLRECSIDPKCFVIFPSEGDLRDRSISAIFLQLTNNDRSNAD